MFVPVVCTWTAISYVLNPQNFDGCFMTNVSYLYVIFALIPNIIIIFVRVEDKLDKEKFLCPKYPEGGF